MTLLATGDRWQPLLHDGEPVIETHENALIVPRRGAWAARGFGVFDRDGRAVVAATDFAGNPAVPAGGSWIADDDAAASARDVAAVTHVYAGSLRSEPDAFLAVSLARLWSHATAHGAAARLLFDAPDGIDDAFADPLTRALLTALGIEAAHCVVPEAPLRVGVLVAPAPAIEPERSALEAHARLLATLGDRLAGPDRDWHEADPLHLTEAGSRSPSFADEAVFDDALRRAGVRVLDPRTTELPTLIAAVRAAAIVSTTARIAGAGLGGAIAQFAAPGASRLVVSTDAAPARNARLVAALLGQPINVLSADPATDGQAMADAFLRVIDRTVGARALPCRRSGAGIPARMDAADRRGVATRSGDGDGDPGDVLDGLLGGRARMRTAYRQRPWWQLDLGEATAVARVAVFAPVDGTPAPAGLRLLGSCDGRDWTVLAARDEDAPPVGGIDGRSHAFATEPDRPWTVRFLRIQMTGTGVLALDQVAVTGPERPEAP